MDWISAGMNLVSSVLNFTEDMIKEVVGAAEKGMTERRQIIADELKSQMNYNTSSNKNLIFSVAAVIAVVGIIALTKFNKK